MTSPPPGVPPDLADVTPVQRRWGLFDELGLSVRYSFSRDTRDGLFADGVRGDSEPRRTVLHETTHLYQSLATPYGAYVYRLKHAQTLLALNVIKALADGGLAVKSPLLRWVRRLPASAAREAAFEQLNLWYLLEAVLLLLEGDPETYARHSARIYKRTGHTLATLFNLADGVLGFLGDGDPTSAPEASRFPVSEPADARELLLEMLLATMLSVTDVLEGAATVAERWNAGGVVGHLADIVGPRAPASNRRGPDLALGYWRGLQRHRFVLAYGAAAELALCSPILPEHGELRTQQTTVADLHPTLRLFNAITRPSVSPPSDLSDVPRFQSELCEANGWPEPWTLAREATRRPRPPGTRFALLHLADTFRVQLPAPFVDLSVWRDGLQTPTALFFKDLFVHAVIEYEDAFLTHKDKERLTQLLLDFVVQSYVRSAMVSSRPVAELPFEASEDELAPYAERLRELLVDNGLEDPVLRVRARPAHQAAPAAQPSATTADV